jgi:hypothetical protein
LKPDSKSSTGYQYTATPLIKPKESDPLERLAASLPAPVIKALPEPEKQPETQVKPEPEKQPEMQAKPDKPTHPAVKSESDVKK